MLTKSRDVDEPSHSSAEVVWRRLKDERVDGTNCNHPCQGDRICMVVSSPPLRLQHHYGTTYSLRKPRKLLDIERAETGE
jgi:hypothetical protein